MLYKRMIEYYQSPVSIKAESMILKSAKKKAFTKTELQASRQLLSRLARLQINVMILCKNRPLTKEQKEHNRKLASIRMRVEHKIRRQIKIFRIIPEVYRNFQKKYNLYFNIVAGLANFKHTF